LRLFLDKPGGSVTLDDCEKVSHLLSPVLDVENIIEGRYFLEVSSPGINRRIKKKADFERFIGSKVKMQLRFPVNGQRKMTGIIEGVEGEEIVIRGGSPEADQPKRVPLASIDRANLQVI
jgi:ribosome maturation factor RimP